MMDVKLVGWDRKWKSLERTRKKSIQILGLKWDSLGLKVMKMCHVPQLFDYKHSNPILWIGMRIHGPVKEVDFVEPL